MSTDASQELTSPAAAHRVTWFAPERPVENGTVFLRPESASPAPTEDGPSED